MNGIYKIIFLISFIIFIGCKNNDNTNSKGKAFIKRNINILIDSVGYFDMSKYLNKKDVFSIALIDSITVEGRHTNGNKSIKYLTFKIHQNDIELFNSKYKLKLVPVKNRATDIVFIQFCDFKINEAKASIIVRQTRASGMIENIFFFEKNNGIWILKKKKMLTIG